MTKVSDRDAAMKSAAPRSKGELFYSYGMARPGRLVADLSSRSVEAIPAPDAIGRYFAGSLPVIDPPRRATSIGSVVSSLFVDSRTGLALAGSGEGRGKVSGPVGVTTQVRIGTPPQRHVDVADLFAALSERDAAMIFVALADKWIADTCFLSSLDAIYSDPALESLLRLGPRAIPEALKYFEMDPERWHHVLVELTGAQPLGPDVSREQAYSVWATYIAGAQL